MSTKSAVFILMFIIMCAMMINFNKFNDLLIEVYRSILKWDAY